MPGRPAKRIEHHFRSAEFKSYVIGAGLARASEWPPAGAGAGSAGSAAAHDDHGPRFKKPQTAYAHFKQAKRSATRASMKKEEAARIGIGLHAEVSDKDVAERLAEMWTTLDASEKQAFEALAVAAWERHARELAAERAAGAAQQQPQQPGAPAAAGGAVV